MATSLVNLSAPSMTSLEISELVGSRHDKVKQSIERLADREVIVLPPLGDVPFVDESGRNRTTSAYIFTGENGKRDSIVVVAQLSPEFTGRLVDRWQALESGEATPEFRLEPEPAQPYRSRHKSLEAPGVQALKLGPSAVRVAKAFGFKENQAYLSANKVIKNITGFNLLAVMEHPALEAPDQEPLLTSTDIAIRLGIGKREANPLLVDCVLQSAHRDHKNRLYYELTDEGKKYGVVMDTDKRSGGTPIRQIKWKASVLKILEARMQVENELKEDAA